MVQKPIVAIVGRPNVGKSTLVNRIIGSREAIVDDTPGVTRDRTYYSALWNGYSFTLVDTGGFESDSDETFQEHIHEQIDVALIESTVVIFVVSAPDGIVALDEELTRQVRQHDKPVIVAVNKVDNPEHMAYLPEFYKLGLSDNLVAISALHGTVGVGNLLDEVVHHFGEDVQTGLETIDSSIRIALVGRPNVGKSSLFNCLVQSERTIVSDVAGTTRDSVDTTISWEEQSYTLVDTAGIRRKSKVSYGVEQFSVDRALRSIRNADVTVLVMDAEEGPTDQDKRIITTSHEAGRALVLVVNKWDLLAGEEKSQADAKRSSVLRQLPHARFSDVVFTSALKRKNVYRILKHAKLAYENNRRRIQTSLLNQVLTEAIQLTPPPHVKNKQLKVFYGSQVKAAPPTFVLFVNDVKLLKDSYRRYLERQLRESFEFTGTPLNFVLRQRQRDKKR